MAANCVRKGDLELELCDMLYGASFSRLFDLLQCQFFFKYKHNLFCLFLVHQITRVYEYNFGKQSTVIKKYKDVQRKQFACGIIEAVWKQ